MSTIRTTLGSEREAARLIRFENAAGINQTNVQKAIEQLATSPPAVSPTAISFVMSPYTPTTNDSLLEIDTSGGAVIINLQPSVARNGRKLAIKDASGNASTNNISLVGNGAQTTDGLPTFLIRTDFGGVEIYPRANGYSVAP